MSQKKTRKRSRRSSVIRAVAAKTGLNEYSVIDVHSKNRVTFYNFICVTQLIARGWAELLRGTVVRLRPWLKLNSETLRANGEPDIGAVSGEELWRHVHNCPTHSICEALFRSRGTMNYTTEQIEKALEDRQKKIHDETKTWGLPASRPFVKSYQSGCSCEQCSAVAELAA